MGLAWERSDETASTAVNGKCTRETSMFMTLRRSKLQPSSSGRLARAGEEFQNAVVVDNRDLRARRLLYFSRETRPRATRSYRSHANGPKKESMPSGQIVHVFRKSEEERVVGGCLEEELQRATAREHPIIRLLRHGSARSEPREVQFRTK